MFVVVCHSPGFAAMILRVRRFCGTFRVLPWIPWPSSFLAMGARGDLGHTLVFETDGMNV